MDFLGNFKKRMKDPLYYNSIFIFLASVIGTPLSFIFWLFAAQYATPESIGIVSSIIGISSWLSIFSKLGFDELVLRQSPVLKEKGISLYNSVYVIQTLVSFSSSILGLILLYNIKNDLFSNILSSVLLSFSFIILSVSTTLIGTQNAIFIGFRNSWFLTLRSLILNLSKILIILILGLLLLNISPLGLLLSVAISSLIAFLVGQRRFLRTLIPNFRILFRNVEKPKRNEYYFSLYMYLSGLMNNLPGSFFPIIIVTFLSEADAGFFSIAWMLSNFLLTIPISIGSSLIVEGLNVQSVYYRDLIYKSLRFTLVILIPLIFIMVLFGKNVLGLFGYEYIERSYNLLVLLSLTAIPYSFIRLYNSFCKILEKTKRIIFTSILTGPISLLGSLLIINLKDISSIGGVWLLVLSSVCIIIIFDYLINFWNLKSQSVQIGSGFD